CTVDVITQSGRFGLAPIRMSMERDLATSQMAPMARSVTPTSRRVIRSDSSSDCFGAQRQTWNGFRLRRSPRVAPNRAPLDQVRDHLRGRAIESARSQKPAGERQALL